MTQQATNADPRHPLKNYIVGLVLSGLLSVFLTALSLAPFVSPLFGGYGITLLLVAAIYIGGPLAVMLVATWLFYMVRSRGQVPAQLHVAMFLPTLIAASIVPMLLLIDNARNDWFTSQHPSMAEVHVNLTDHPLWLRTTNTSSYTGASPRMPMEPKPDATFVSLTRYPERDAGPSDDFPYEGTRLRQNLDVFKYDSDKAIAAGTPASLPLVRLPYPDIRALTHYEPESVLLVHQYFHYNDHVEVAPGLRLMAASTEDKLLGKVDSLTAFYVSNRYTQAIARLEINGQTMAFSEDYPISGNSTCNASVGRPSGPSGEALVDINQPLRVRWQSINAPGHWQEATVDVPSFRSIHGGAKTSFPSVMLYFTRDGHVAAERFQLLRLAREKQAIQATGLPSSVPIEESCGSAADRYDLNNVTLLTP